MKFNESMIGKRVKEIESGDFGFVVREHDLLDDVVWVDWDREGELWIALDEIVFSDDIADVKSIDEITINGKRYKLTLIE